jgi:hypothetical protein
MCVIVDVREYGQTPDNAKALLLAAVLAGKSEAAGHRPEFTGMVMLHAAQYFAERMAETIGEHPGACLLAALQRGGADHWEIDAALIRRVVSGDADAGRFFAQRLESEAAGLVTEDGLAATRLAVACVVLARSAFTAFADECGAGADKGGDICAGAAYPRMLRYEVVH